MRARVWFSAAALVAAVVVGAGVAAFIWWPSVHLGAPGDALARVAAPRFAGEVTAVQVRSANGDVVPVELRDGRVTPRGTVASGERVTVELTVRRPGWAAWLVGRTDHPTFTVETPSAHLLGRWLQIKSGGQVTVAFDKAVSVVSLAGKPPRRLDQPRRAVPIGLVASGTHLTGAVDVAVAARTWERPSAPVRVNWFPARPYPQLLAKPTPGTVIGPKREFTLTFSSPVAEVLGARRPRLSPALPGNWRLIDAHTLAFRPRGLGFGLGTEVRVVLPQPVHIAGRKGAVLTSTLRWQVPEGATLRLQQLLAQLGYLPLDWHPSANEVSSSVGAELVAARAPPPGHFSWRFRKTPRELQRLWHPGRANVITRGAVMMFQHRHGLVVDGLAGPVFWQSLIHDAIDRQAAHGRLQLRVRAPQAAAVAQPVAQRARDPALAGQYRRARSSHATRYVSGVRARPGGRDARHEPGWHHLRRSRDPVHQLFPWRRRDPRLQPQLLRYAAEPRLRRVAAARGREGLALHADRHARHGRELRGRRE